eukprot:735279-Pelagomonas_calceolata.AAC.2
MSRHGTGLIAATACAIPFIISRSSSSQPKPTCVRVRNPDSSVSSSLPGLKARRGQHLCPCARGRARGRLDRSALLLPLHSPRALCRTQTLCRRQDMSPSPNSCAIVSETKSKSVMHNEMLDTTPLGVLVEGMKYLPGDSTF